MRRFAANSSMPSLDEQMFVQTACALLIIGFMLFILFFDVQDWFGPRGHSVRFKKTPASETPNR